MLDVYKRQVSGFAGAYNIREDSKCAGRRSSENITIESKEDKPGINIRVKPFTAVSYTHLHICAAFRPVDNRLYSVYSAACIFNFEQRHFSELIFNTDNVLQIIIRYAL